MPSLIELEDVHRSYAMGHGAVRALRGVSLRVERGEYVAVMGPSGSGKSTLLQMIGCLDRPSRGRYVLDGTPVAELDDEELSRLRSRKIGFVFQAFHLIPQLDVAENVELPLVYQGVDPASRAQRSAEVLAQVGLSGRSAHRPRELSGGECQRVAVARALVASPDLLLADEPTGNLDSRTGEEIMDLLDALNAKGVSVVLVTHDLAKARRARRVVLMQDGAIAREFVGDERLEALGSLDAGRDAGGGRG
jgi:putative ABC transport system ATP-binding protein